MIRFETAMGEQLQVDWVEFRKGEQPLHAFCATLDYSRASYVEFVSHMKVETLIGCHERAFAALGGVPRSVLYDNMKTVILERNASFKSLVAGKTYQFSIAVDTRYNTPSNRADDFYVVVVQ